MVASNRSLMVRSVVVEASRVVDQRSRNVVLHRLIDCVEIGQNGPNPGCHEMLLGSHSHAARDQYGYTSEQSGHGRMFVVVVVAMFAMGIRSE